MNYEDYNDYELLNYVLENNEDASKVLYQKYEPIIKNLAGKMYVSCKNYGIELSDLIQEGMIGLAKAIDTFNDDKETTFYTYAITCIKRNMDDLRKNSSRLKHQALNSSIPIEMENADGEEINLENFLNSNTNNPESMLLTKETEKMLIDKISKKLTPFEKEVFQLKYKHYDYKEIAEILNKTPKQVDNTLQRIKIKLSNIIKEK